MKKALIACSVLFLAGCVMDHTNEDVIGYNDEGKTIVKVCKYSGTPANPSAFGSTCKVELRDYGRVSNKADTINIISNDKR